MILHSKPWVTGEDDAAVLATLHSGMIGRGVQVERLEQTLALWVNQQYGQVASSGSAGLLMALRALNVAGQDVVLPTYACSAVWQAVLAAGASPVLCDVGPGYVLSHDTVKAVMTRKTACIVAPHMYGIYAAIPSLLPLGVPVIEDCAQAVFAEGDNQSKADLVVWSMGATKCFTAGEGGCVTTSNADLAYRLRQDSAGAGLSDFAAALALSQLTRYYAFLVRRALIAARYDVALAYQPPLRRTMNYRYVLRRPGGLEDCQQAFADCGVIVRRGVDVLLHRWLNLPDSAFPTAVRYYNETVSLPLYPALTDDEAAQVATAARELFA